MSFSESSGSSLKRIWKTPSERSLSELSNPDLSNGDDFKNQQAFKAELIQRFSLPANTLCFGFLIISIMLSQRFMRDESLHFNIKILITILVLKSIFIICSSISVKFENFELINLVPFIISLLLGLYFQIKLYKNVKGPLPADSAFIKIKKRTLFISTYHDQVLIPFKLINKKSFNLTLGLQYKRLSPAHGTAKDIKKKYIAENRSYLTCQLF